jgi:hypothetical protein
MEDLKQDLEKSASQNGDSARAHLINAEIMQIIRFRQSRKWIISITLVGVQAAIIFSMLVCVGLGVSLDTDAKEILLLIIGGLSVSLNKSIDFWMSSSEDDEQYLKSAQQDSWNGK